MTRSFLFYGLWTHPSHKMVFNMSHDVWTLSGEGREICITPVSFSVDAETDSVLFELRDPKVVHPPTDWYNIRKYASHIRYFRMARTHGVSVAVSLVDPSRLIVRTRIRDEVIPEFQLTRHCSE